MELSVFAKYQDVIGYIDNVLKPKDRVKAKIVLDGLLVGWVMILILALFTTKNSPIFYKSVWMLFVLSLALFFMRLKDLWVLSIHTVSLGILAIILYDIVKPGFTPDILLIQHAFLVIFFAQMVIMNVWGNIYTIITILSIGWIISQRRMSYTFNVYEDWADFYLLLISFAIILYMMFKNLKVLRSLIRDIESSRISETVLYKDIKNAAQKAEHQNEKKTIFFSTISHELRTPLNAIVGFSNLLRSDFEEQNIPENLKLLHFSAEYLASTINNVMESTNNANYINATSSESSFDLEELVQNVYKGLKIKADKKGINFDFEYAPELNGISLIGLVDRLTQVIYNLADNAIKFTKRGNVRIKILFVKRIHSHVDIEFQVQDTGIGIPSHKIKDIFKPYQQATEKINREFGGTGLGLTIVDKLLKMMNSEIHCVSELGKGTTFYFRMQFLIPNYRSTHDVTAHLENQIGMFKGMKILVAEDNDLNIKLVRRILEKWEVDFDMAVDGVEAYQKALDNDYDLILMDVNMPRMTGIESTKLIHVSKPEQKIIFLTANIQQDVVDEMKRLKVFGYLIKPFKVEDLKGLLYKVLN